MNPSRLKTEGHFSTSRKGVLFYLTSELDCTSCTSQSCVVVGDEVLSSATTTSALTGSTVWVADSSPTHSTSTPVKLESALQFVPPNTNPKEFKTVQKMIKENRRVGNISAGPTSHLLEGVTWDEARRMQDASMSGASDHVILVGAASKGIIQRDFQHNAVVYKTPYAKNPFDAVTDQELEEYKDLVERKQRGDPSTCWQGLACEGKEEVEEACGK
ncbi:Protein hu-li tai shao [Portunus trituberculatus]|uniref:Protein hu-li tai shao n=1 Tax=Portunus trituberculatus TaxID=210409 RepID=A0A5B7DWH9_PORTR|nr:Protein hu-li tai shao [Portunus trituberculatus]